ncbi:hypothetical protein J5226_12960 [Lysobacter sp. K5869]|uniref:hypothetical protein n=1 Tax=Lysobacter sp. K5869 TaxID=2820808 RepID=UPI001C063842|nr:hypothetical protein [Lysobacter sp. K5869]QWP74610.1 hypothetical protein J5226_12960 [Lysobacter sp. K5869]
MAGGFPTSSERLVETDGRPTFAWFRILSRIGDMVSLGDVKAFFRALLVKLGSPDGTLENLPPVATGSFLTKDTRVEGEFSVDYSGTLESGLVRLSLVGDEEAPLPTSYYGTGPIGEKGWRTIASAFLPGEGITLTEAGDGSGVITVALAELADAGGGELRKFVRDAYGRLAGTSAATTDDLAEGLGNLYFTDARAVAALETTGPDYLQLLLNEYNPP